MDEQPHKVDVRKMQSAELLGRHSHQTEVGICVHIYIRDGRFLARGRFEGQAFGQSLGETESEASIKLRHLLTSLDNGSFLPARRASKLPIKTSVLPRLTFDEVAARFLKEKRETKGQQTMKDYRSRLAPLIAFSTEPATRKRWPLARDVDREFVLESRAFLFALKTTPNGKPGATRRSLSVTQIRNILETGRSMMHWAASPAARLLPGTFINPFTTELVGHRPLKDPLRSDILPLMSRILLASQMDCWQLGSIGWSLVLPLRPDELVGVLISDVDLVRSEIHVCTRMGGSDFSKSRLSFTVPIPPELEPFIYSCINGRVEGPLLLRKAIWQGRRKPRHEVSNIDELKQLFENALEKAAPGTIVTEQDRKAVFRTVLHDLGGASTDELCKEFKKVARALGMKTRYYDTRHAVSRDMHRAGVGMLELRYLTGHAVNDILNEYISLDPHGELKKYWAMAKPLLDALLARGTELGCLPQVAA